jgi:uncharacterized membrane protein
MTNLTVVAALEMTKLLVPANPASTVEQILRWVHFVAGITWIGLLYFFNLVNVPFMKELDAPTKGKVVPILMPRALWWFRWSSVITVLAGFIYWAMILGADARNAQLTSGIHANPGQASWTFFAIWTLAFAIEMGVLMSPAAGLKTPPVLAVIIIVVVSAASYLFVSVNSHGWESNRALSIGIGGGMGWFMMLNVWGIIWRMQKKIIAWTADSAKNGTPMPPDAAKLARLAFLASRVNFGLSFPLLFFMAAASHYPFLVQ